MKVFGKIMAAVASLAAIGAAVFVVIKYGDKIVAWFKKTFSCTCICNCGTECDCGEDCECECECVCECCTEAAAEEAAQEAPVQEEAAVQPQAEEADFEN